MKTTRSDSAHEAGFSLIELVVAVGILTIVMGAAFELMARSQENFDRNELLAEAHQNADFAVVRVTEMVRSAGVNPSATSTVNNIPFVSNTDANNQTDDNRIRLLADYNGNGNYNDQVGDVNQGALYFILTSEDVTLRFFPDPTTVNSVAIPGNTICLIDNTPSADHTPVVLASHIVSVNFHVPTANLPSITLTVTGGPSKAVLPNDPRYTTFTRTMQIRLRNR